MLNEEEEIVGFGVMEGYDFAVGDLLTKFLYLQGMVIATKYHGMGYATKLLESLYQHFLGLRTQNVYMAKALLHLFLNPVWTFPSNFKDELVINSIRTLLPYQNMDNSGIIKECYTQQLYPHLEELEQIVPGIHLGSTDALAVIVQKESIISKKKIK